jgi:hypothetical protein
MARVRVKNRRDDFFFGIGIVVQQDHRLGLPRRVFRDVSRNIFRRCRGLGQVIVGLRALDERRYQMIQLAVHRSGNRLGFAQLIGIELTQKILERLPGAEHAHVGQCRRRQVAT